MFGLCLYMSPDSYIKPVSCVQTNTITGLSLFVWENSLTLPRDRIEKRLFMLAHHVAVHYSMSYIKKCKTDTLKKKYFSLFTYIQTNILQPHLDKLDSIRVFLFHFVYVCKMEYV